MSLIAILISLALEKLLPAIEPVRKLEWYDHFSDWIYQRLNTHSRLRGIVALLLTILLPVIAVALLQALFDDILVFLGFLFGIAVLTYCLGPNNPLYAVNRFLNAHDRGETENMTAALGSLMDEVPENADRQQEAVVRQLLMQSHERITGILFWFIVLGPIGAVLFRLSVEQALREYAQPHEDNADFSAAAVKLFDLLAWIPARLTALAYAVMGSFTHALRVWHPSGEGHDVVSGETEDRDAGTAFGALESRQLLVRVGLGAMQHDGGDDYDIDKVREAYGLCSRSLITWLTLLALLTLAGWIA